MSNIKEAQRQYDNQSDDDSNALYTDIERELLPIVFYLKFNYVFGELMNIGLNCPFKEFKKANPEITREELIKLLDWFTDNRTVVQQMLELTGIA